MHYRKARRILSPIGSNISFAAGTCCTITHTIIMASYAKFSRCDMSHGVEQVELHATFCRGKFCTNFTCTSEKVSAHTRGCVAATRPWNTFQQLFHKYANSVIWSLLHVPATEPCSMSRQCVLNTILFPLHFAATWCSCNMSPHVGPPLVRGVMLHILRLTIWALYKASCGI